MVCCEREMITQLLSLQARVLRVVLPVVLAWRPGVLLDTLSEGNEALKEGSPSKTFEPRRMDLHTPVLLQ